MLTLPEVVLGMHCFLQGIAAPGSIRWLRIQNSKVQAGFDQKLACACLAKHTASKLLSARDPRTAAAAGQTWQYSARQQH